jgi:hypothetical protein
VSNSTDAVSDRRPAVHISATRALKNARHLQKVAPQIMPKTEPAEGYGSVIPLKALTQLHRPDRGTASGLSPKLLDQLKGVVFPDIGLSGDPLFHGTLYFARIEFTIQDHGNAQMAVSTADLTTAIEYASYAASPISAYANQYGPNSIGVDPTIIPLSVTLPSTSYNDAKLQGWVNAIATANGLGSNACVVVLNPTTLTNTSGDRAVGIGGYHSLANVPYIFVNLFGENLTVADQAFAYAQILSHEMAEMIVDPLVDGKNPEVCDGCGPNCQSVYLDYFTDAGKYLGTTQTFPPAFAYDFYINGIVKPASATACPAPAAACNYAPPLQIPFRNRVLAHERDAAWLIQLWLAIHGGDPARRDLNIAEKEVGLLATVRAIAALARCLGDTRVEHAVAAALQPVAERVGAKIEKELKQIG